MNPKAPQLAGPSALETSKLHDMKETIQAAQLSIALLLANAEANEEKAYLRDEVIRLADAVGLRLGTVQLDGAAGALLRDDRSPALWAELDPEGPHGEAFVDLGTPPDPRMVRLINLVIGAPEESLDGGEAEDRIFRPSSGGGLRFGFGESIELYPGDARGVDLCGPLRLSLSPSAGCWFVVGEEAAERGPSP